MNMALGYNVKKADSITTEIARCYKDFGARIKDEWEAVQSKMQLEWIGPDQQDFEKHFVKRVNDMYLTTYDLAKNAITNVETLTNDWIGFQNKNTITGEALGTAKVYKSEASVTQDASIISQKERTFSDSDDMGLANEESAANISSSVSTFVKNLKNNAQTLFGAIDTTNAFFGSQDKALKKYIEKIGEAMAEITSAVKDLDEALATLAKTNYATSDTNIESSLKTAAKDTEASLNELGGTRWTTE